MALQILDANSSPAVFSELDLFTVPPTQVAVERAFSEEIRPMNTVTDEGPYEFAILGNQFFLDMGANSLYLKLKITKEDGSDITEHPPGASEERIVGNYGVPINLIGETFVKQLKMYINGKLAYDSGDNYPFLAYMITDLNYNDAQRKTILVAAGYDLECDETVTNSLILRDYRNPGFKKKFERVKNSRSFETKAPLHFPFAHQEKYVLNGMDIRFELFRSSNSFALMTGNKNDLKFKIHVEDIKFNIRKVELTQQLCLALETALERQTAKYPIRRLELKTLQIDQGRLTTPENNIWSGQLPRRVVLCLVDSESYYGNYEKNPFTFEHHGVEKVAMYVNGQCVPFSGPLNTQFRNRSNVTVGEAAQAAPHPDLKIPDLVVKAYTQFNEALGIGHNEKSNGVTLERFLIDACYFVFDLSQDNITDKSSWELLRAGTLSIYLKFRNEIGTNGLRVMILGEFDNLITINKNRDIEYDYSY